MKSRGIDRRLKMTADQIMAHQSRHGFLIPAGLSDSGAQEARQSASSAPAVSGQRFTVVRAPEPKKKTKPERMVEQQLLWLKNSGQIADFEFEGITLKVGEPSCRYTPDFTVWTPDGRLRFIEVKGGYIYPDAMVKFRAAKRQYPLASFELWQLIGHELKQII